MIEVWAMGAGRLQGGQLVHSAPLFKCRGGETWGQEWRQGKSVGCFVFMGSYRCPCLEDLCPEYIKDPKFNNKKTNNNLRAGQNG